MKSVQAELTKPGTESWHFQLNQSGLTLEKDQLYTFSFWAKSDPPRSIQDRGPVGTRALVLPGTQSCGRFDEPVAAIHDGRFGPRLVGEFLSGRMGLRQRAGRVWLSGPSLKPGGVLGTPQGQSLAQANIGLTRTHDTAARQADYQRFLMETEQRYHADMMQFLKKDLGLRSLVTNTQASYGGLAGLLARSDALGLRRHARILAAPAFSRSSLGSQQLEHPQHIDGRRGDGGVLGRIALHRVQGKPFTVSEYNHPTPNDHCAEMFPMLASLAAFQDWDGVYQFTYSQSSDELERPDIDSYFDLVNHPGQLVWLPIAATIFRTAAVDAGCEPMVLRIPAQDKCGGHEAASDRSVVGGRRPAQVCR